MLTKSRENITFPKYKPNIVTDINGIEYDLNQFQNLDGTYSVPTNKFRSNYNDEGLLDVIDNNGKIISKTGWIQGDSSENIRNKNIQKRLIRTPLEQIDFLLNETGLGIFPGIGDIADIVSITKDLKNNDLTNASITLGLAAIPGGFVNQIGRGVKNYSKFVKNNYNQLGRYTLEYLTPASYSVKNFATVPKIYIKPLYEAPPIFHNGRKPRWYKKYSTIRTPEAAEQRFQNGAIWAGIPEDEIPRTMYAINPDGSYRFTKLGLNIDSDGKLNGFVDDEDFPDIVSIGGVGGLHSNYINMGTNFINNQPVTKILFKDEQVLNPQWIITHPIKKLFPKNSKIHNKLHYIGGYPLNKLLGYKPFTIEHPIIRTSSGMYPLYD